MNNGVVIFIAPVGERVLAQVLPDVFLWIEFQAIGRQSHQADIVWHDKGFGGVPSGAIDNDDGMSATCDFAADLGIPYLHLIDDLDIYHLWEACNLLGWFKFRAAYLDKSLPTKYRDSTYLDEDRMVADLDGFITKTHPWIERWLDRLIETGDTIDHAMDVIGRWLKDRKSIEALSLTASAVVHLGRRSDLTLLDVAGIEPSDDAAEIVADTQFAVE